MLQEVQMRANIVAMDLNELNPQLGNLEMVNRTALLSRNLIGCAFAACRRGL
jgi:arginase family enzyme